MSNARDVDSQGNPIVETPIVEDKIDKAIDAKPQGLEGGDPLLDILIKSVEQMVGLDTHEERVRYKDNIGTLLEWAKMQTDSPTPENIKWAIRQLEMRVGTPPIGEKLVSRLARIAYLEMESKNIEKEIKSYVIS